jgi:hypothetical protein
VEQTQHIRSLNISDDVGYIVLNCSFGFRLSSKYYKNYCVSEVVSNSIIMYRTAENRICWTH